MSFFRTIAGGIAIHILMKYCFPQQYDMLFITSFTKTIYLYSFIEILLKKQLKGTEKYPLIKNILSIFKKIHNEIEVIKFNEPCFVMSVDEYNNWIHYRLDYDFIIYSHKESEESTMYNRVLYHTIEKPINPSSYKLCGFSFISIQVSIEDIKDRSKTNSYYLKLRTDEENYYIAGNKINHDVIFYLLKTQCNVDYPPFTPYIMDIIDFNANLQFLTENDTICLLENDYKVIHSEMKLTMQIPETNVFDDETESECETDSDLDDLPDLIEMKMDVDIEYKQESLDKSIEIPDLVRVESVILIESQNESESKNDLITDKKEEIEMNIDVDIDEEISQMKKLMESDDIAQKPKQKRKYNKRKMA